MLEKLKELYEDAICMRWKMLAAIGLTVGIVSVASYRSLFHKNYCGLARKDSANYIYPDDVDRTITGEYKYDLSDPQQSLLALIELINNGDVDMYFDFMLSREAREGAIREERGGIAATFAGEAEKISREEAIRRAKEKQREESRELNANIKKYKVLSVDKFNLFGQNGVKITYEYEAIEDGEKIKRTNVYIFKEDNGEWKLAQ